MEEPCAAELSAPHPGCRHADRRCVSCRHQYAPPAACPSQRVWWGGWQGHGSCCPTRLSYISSRALSAAAFAAAARGQLHWVHDVTFGEDLSRLRTGHGAKNMAVVRHFALNLVRQVADKRSIESAPPGPRNTCWTLSARCSQSRVNLDSLPCGDAVVMLVGERQRSRQWLGGLAARGEVAFSICIQSRFGG
jgi:predicted transposase YbfD/YdcC